MTEKMSASEFVKTAKKPRKHEHTRLVHAIIDFLKLYPQKIRIWQANTAALPVGKRFIRCGRKGQADISGIWFNGLRVEVEAKIGKDKLRPEQIEFRTDITDMGGVFIEARDVKDVDFLVK